MTFAARAFAALLMLAPMLSTAQAQVPAEPAARVRDAFASDYGKALIAELGKNLRRDADPACLSTKWIAADQLEARGLELMAKWGTRMMETHLSLLDKKILAEKFPGSAELEKLRADKTVARYLVIAQPIRQTQILDTTFEQFDRYVLIKRIKLTPVSPLASGNATLLDKGPSDAAREKVEKFIAGNKSAALKRYLALAEQEAAAMKAALKLEQPLRPVPSIYFEGVETDLEALCISRR